MNQINHIFEPAHKRIHTINYKKMERNNRTLKLTLMLIVIITLK